MAVDATMRLNPTGDDDAPTSSLSFTGWLLASQIPCISAHAKTKTRLYRSCSIPFAFSLSSEQAAELL